MLGESQPEFVSVCPVCRFTSERYTLRTADMLTEIHRRLYPEHAPFVAHYTHAAQPLEVRREEVTYT
jgi:hypothetical protein